jgi:hypothetical protein
MRCSYHLCLQRKITSQRTMYFRTVLNQKSMIFCANVDQFQYADCFRKRKNKLCVHRLCGNNDTFADFCQYYDSEIFRRNCTYIQPRRKFAFLSKRKYLHWDKPPLPTKYPAFHDSQNLVNKSKSSMKIRIPSIVFLETGPKDPSQIKKNPARHSLRLRAVQYS